ncbi:hypothetical protein CJ030_MR5G023509 [Morella rubra]|uniref:Uncharacterized protein n=1 Tax=Morella rubra TaxID=262757 RepID=A0A6A1VIZ6_9ROSI|nr:hypothetical protein CJ030_MR5G023509 [Morella rubra]
MKRGREFPSVTSGQLHSYSLSMSPIPSPTLSAPSPRVNEGMSQGTPACPSSCAYGIWTSEGAREIYHQLAKARDEIEAMRAAREKDLQEFAKKQAEMEATLRDHRESSGWSRAHPVGVEERMKRSKSACEWSTRSVCKRNKSACERSKSAYGQKYRRSWRRKCPL